MLDIIQVNELIVLLVIISGYIPISLAWKNDRNMSWVFYAYTALFLGAVLTIVEDVVTIPHINTAEHVIGILGAGVLFYICAYKSQDRLDSVARQAKKIKANGKKTKRRKRK